MQSIRHWKNIVYHSRRRRYTREHSWRNSRSRWFCECTVWTENNVKSGDSKPTSEPDSRILVEQVEQQLQGSFRQGKSNCDREMLKRGHSARWFLFQQTRSNQDEEPLLEFTQKSWQPQWRREEPKDDKQKASEQLLLWKLLSKGLVFIWPVLWSRRHE